MKFRLGMNTQPDAGTSAGSGFGRGFAALFQAPVNEALAGQQAQDDALKQQLTSSMIASHVAQAAHSNAQADLTRGEATALNSAPDVLDRVIASHTGVDVPTVQAWRQQITTGKAPTTTVPGDPTADAPMQDGMVTLPRMDPTLGQRIGTEYGRLAPALINPKGFKIDDLAQAAGQYQKQDAVDKIAASGGAAPGPLATVPGAVPGTQPAAGPGAVSATAASPLAALYGQAYAAIDGKPMVDNVGNTGRSFNKFTGDGGTIDPALSALYDRNVQSEVTQHNAAAGASNASAVHSYASADEARAQTRKINADVERDVRSGDLQVVTGTDGAITIVNKRNQTATPVLGADGKPVIKGAAGGGGKPLTGDQAKANLYGGRMMESDAILQNMEKQGVFRPGGIKSTAEGLGRIAGLGTEGVGGTLADMAGSMTNWTQSPQQQQVEQARRDFINAVLRRESGAAISPAEFINADKQYFPAKGDSAQVLEQKRRNRQIATNLMLQEVPEAARYKLGTGYGAQSAQPSAAPPSGARAGRTVSVNY